MSVYYNDTDEYCCLWLFNLMEAGLIPYGDVDQRPIQEVTPQDVRSYTQCHFFAGIAGWAYALRIAGWPDDRPVWTGSCPCQPFSVAGKRKGFSDDRDLWPHWYHLIRECRPTVCMGEQVASAADWLARVRSDLEEVGYAVGCLPIQAACAGAAQYRDRYWIVADAKRDGWGQGPTVLRAGQPIVANGREDGSLAYRDLQRQTDGGLQRGGQLGGPSGAAGDPDGAVARQSSERLEERCGLPGGPGEQLASGERNRPLGMVRPPLDGWGQGWTEHELRSRGFSAAVASSPDGSVQFVECPDTDRQGRNKWRRLPPPRVRWLGNDVPSRVAKLRALGNSIYPPLAAEVVRAYMECRP